MQEWLRLREDDYVLFAGVLGLRVWKVRYNKYLIFCEGIFDKEIKASNLESAKKKAIELLRKELQSALDSLPEKE